MDDNLPARSAPLSKLWQHVFLAAGLAVLDSVKLQRPVLLGHSLAVAKFGAEAAARDPCPTGYLEERNYAANFIAIVRGRVCWADAGVVTSRRIRRCRRSHLLVREPASLGVGFRANMQATLRAIHET